MDKIVRLAVLAAVVYFGATQLIPWMKEKGDFSSGRAGTDLSEIADNDCVSRAMGAPELFASEIRSFGRPPVDEAAWDDSYARIQGRIDSADDACSCSEPSCDKAREGLSQLRGLAGEYAGAFRDGGSPPLNAARELDGIWDLLNEAASLARDGS
jgi:hypothetical protein